MDHLTITGGVTVGSGLTQTHQYVSAGTGARWAAVQIAVTSGTSALIVLGITRLSVAQSNQGPGKNQWRRKARGLESPLLFVPNRTENDSQYQLIEDCISNYIVAISTHPST